MPRPQRIEYENAFYHVMNRGRGRQTIFPGQVYYLHFLDCVAQANQRFGAVVHAYCLMGNHYHLLLETPHANLSRVMQHINGVYTQRHNRLKKTDGMLFRGRYKAIIVDADSYLLQVGRYIHRNPVETAMPLVKRLEQYPWSSYPAYLGKTSPPAWLDRELMYTVLGKRQRFSGYRSYVELGVDEETRLFYSKGNQAAVIGNREFKAALLEEREDQVSRRTPLSIHGRPTLDRVIEVVVEYYRVPAKRIIVRQRGRQEANRPRKVAMYLGQQVGFSLGELVTFFGVKHVGTVSHAITQIKRDAENDTRFNKEIEQIKGNIWM